MYIKQVVKLPQNLLRVLVEGIQRGELLSMEQDFPYIRGEISMVGAKDAQILAPAVKEGKIVICDRFVDSSIAYQQYGRGLGECVRIINGYAIDGWMPDLTFFLKVKPDIGEERIESREKDRIELEDMSFHEAVYRGYESLQEEFSDRIVGIDAARPVEEIFAEIKRYTDMLLKR